ncbi:MAG: type IV pilus biogenesis protein PilP [Methyloprofundus sp.]|nr:type IV pilus biogenesis protein PilP [Methyloprofundus sp.]
MFAKIVFTLICAAYLGIATAQEPSLPDNLNNQMVKELQEKKRLAQAMLELEEVQKKRRDLNSDPADTSTPQINAPTMSWPGNYSGSARIEPVVLSIEGKHDRLRALLLVGQGITQRVKTGDTANGWKVIKVEHDGVLASKDGQAKFLAFGDSNYVPQEQAQNPNLGQAQQPYQY